MGGKLTACILVTAIAYSLQDAIKLFDITQPMIPQREVRDVTFRGTAARSTDRWYG
jgi:hypothetical protein